MRPGALPMRDGHRIIAELDADLGQDAVRGGLYPPEVFVGQHIIGRDIAHDVGTPHTAAFGGALRLAGLSATAYRFFLAHRLPSLIATYPVSKGVSQPAVAAIGDG